MTAEFLDNLVSFLNGDNVQTIFRCLKEKKAFDEKTALTHTEIYNYTGLPKSTISRILKTFKEGKVAKSTNRGRFRTWHLTGIQTFGQHMFNSETILKKRKNYGTSN